MACLGDTKYLFAFHPLTEHCGQSLADCETLDLHISFKDNKEKFVIDHIGLLERDQKKVKPNALFDIFMNCHGKRDLETWLNYGYTAESSFVRRRVGQNCWGEFWWSVTVTFEVNT